MELHRFRFYFWPQSELIKLLALQFLNKWSFQKQCILHTLKINKKIIWSWFQVTVFLFLLKQTVRQSWHFKVLTLSFQTGSLESRGSGTYKKTEVSFLLSFLWFVSPGFSPASPLSILPSEISFSRVTSPLCPVWDWVVSTVVRWAEKEE